MRRTPDPLVTRRQLLRGAASACVAYAVPSLCAREAAAAETAPVIVQVFLRGGADGLSLVVPHGDARYAALRPTIALAPSATHDLDGFFGLHPSLAALAPLYDAGSLAIVHAVGSPDPTRSHFGAQDFLETAAPGQPAVRDGWLNRWLASLSSTGAFAGITIGSSRTLSLSGAVHTASLVSLDTFQAGGLLHAARQEALAAGFAAGGNARIEAAAEEMFDTAAVLSDVSRQTSVVYPFTGFASALKDAAALIKGSLGVRAAAIDLPGWDHHGEANGVMPGIAETLATALAAFHRDLGTHAARTLVLVTTEFGRTAAENGSGGADHGHGSVSFVLGGGVRGGRVLLRGGRWPGLAPGDLWDGRDLAVTTDFRDLFAEILRRHLGVASPSALLPGFVANAANEPGLFS
jgi:uncharacterized protein (DUF1501 family)